MTSTVYLSHYLLGDPEVTTNVYCKSCSIQYSQYRYAKLQYRFAVTSGSPSSSTQLLQKLHNFRTPVATNLADKFEVVWYQNVWNSILIGVDFANKSLFPFSSEVPKIWTKFQGPDVLQALYSLPFTLSTNIK